MADYHLEYEADGEVLAAYIADRSFFTGIMGPWGSGKSVGSIIKLMMLAAAQAPSTLDGYRKTRWIVVRDTTPLLKSTTIKTWKDWFPEHVFGDIKWSAPITHHLRFDDIDCEVIFLALDNDDDVDKALQ